MTDQNRKSLGSIFLSLVLGIAVGTAAHATLRSESNKWADGVSAAAGVSTSASAYALISSKRKRRESADATTTQSCCEQTAETLELPADASRTTGIALPERDCDFENAVVSEATLEGTTASVATVDTTSNTAELDIVPRNTTLAALTEGLATEESEQVSKTALPQLCQESTRDDANETGFSNEAGYSASRIDAEGKDFDIRIGLPVLSRSQYRRATGVPQRLKSIEGIVWSNTTMLDDGRRIMEGTFAADSNIENIWNLVLSTLGVQRS
ncbi:MAG: hypothetical protein IAF58_17455 [Leptolyngbya sp.]|nr:hypothetical protein [Candidatus Melainabacteria bacterium]